MGKKVLGYTGGLIALYLLVANGSQAGNLITQGASGGSKIIGTLQGRTV